MTEAGGGNRTRVISLEGWSSTIELHPRLPIRLASVLLAHTHSPYAWQADVDTTVVIPVLVAALPVRGRAVRSPSVADRLLRRLAGDARGRVLDARPPPRTALPAHRAPAPERDPRGVGAAPRGARRLAARWPSGSPASRWWRLATHPAFALPVWLGNYFFWHVPPIYDAALRHQAWLIHLEHGCYFGDRDPLLVAARPGRPAPASVRRPRGVRIRGVRPRSAARPAARPLAEARLRLLRPCADGLGARPDRRPGDRRRDDGRRAGDRPVRRLPLLVPAVPRRRRRYLRQPLTRSRSGWLQWTCQSMTALRLLAAGRRRRRCSERRTSDRQRRCCSASATVLPKTSVSEVVARAGSSTRRRSRSTRRSRAARRVAPALSSRHAVVLPSE